MRLALFKRLRPIERITIGLLAFIALCLCVPFAHAQAIDAPRQTFDFGPLAYAVIEFVAPMIVAVGGPLGIYVLGRFLKLLGLKQDALWRETIEQGLEKSIAYAVSQLGDRAKGGIPLPLKNQAITMAAGYAEAMIPQALVHFQKTSTDISAMIEARLDQWLLEPDDEPASPPADRIATLRPAS